jgi:CRISPR-associated endonuclease Csn1
MTMKKILGLDLGIASIGWAMIQVDEDWKRKEILGMGVRVVPLGTN